MKIIKTAILTVLLGILLPVTAFADIVDSETGNTRYKVDPGNIPSYVPQPTYSGDQGAMYALTNGNDDGHRQTQYIAMSKGSDGKMHVDSIYMVTEGNGDSKWQGGARYETKALNYTIGAPGLTSQTHTLYSGQQTVAEEGGRVWTGYYVQSPDTRDLDTYMHDTYGEAIMENYYGTVSHETSGPFAKSTNSFIEASGMLAVTPDGQGQTWSAYTVVVEGANGYTDPKTNIHYRQGTVRMLSAYSLVYDTKIKTSSNGSFTLDGAVSLRNSLYDERKELDSIPKNERTPEQNIRLTNIEQTISELSESITKAIPNGMKAVDWSNLVDQLGTEGSSFNTMMTALEKAAKETGTDISKWNGTFSDSNLDFGVRALYKMGFKDPQAIINHLDWQFTGTDEEKLEKITEIIEELEEESGGDKPDFRKEPYEPWGEITHSAVEKEHHRVGGDGNIFDLGEPIAYTYNDSVEYTDYAGWHIGFADEGDSDGNGNGIIIPSSERYLNGITVNTTNGKASLGLGSQTSTYVGKYSYQIQQYITAYEKIDVYLVDGDEVDEDEYDDAKDDPDADTEHTYKVEPATIKGCLWAMDFKHHPGITVSTKRYGYYLYLEDLDVKDFNNMTTYNDTFTNDTQDYNASTDPHVYRDIPPGEVRVNSIGGSVQGRPTTYHVEEGYRDGAVNITSTAADSAAGRKTSSFEPDGFWHLDWNVDPTDWGYGNYDLGVFRCYQTAEEVGIDGEFESVPTASGLYHYWGGDVTNNPPRSVGGVEQRAKNQLNYDVGDMKSVSTKTAGGEVWHLAEYKTGKLTLPGAGGAAQEIMGGQSGQVTHKGANDSWDSSFEGTEVPSYLKAIMTAILGAGQAYQNAKESMIESYESTPALGKEQQHIPDEQANGEYPTSIQNVFYKQVLVAKAMAGKTTSGMGIKPVYNPNEPIIIQTPVVSPVSVWLDTGTETGSSGLREYSPGEGENQLVHEDDAVRQFRLDENYWFKFDPLQHLITQGYADINGIPFDNTWRDDNIKFDKYTEAKYVHFPFDVCLYEDGTDGHPTYHPHTENESDPNYWIKIYDRNDSGTMDNIEWTKFYIPAWAHEDDYSSGDVIKYKVEAINVTNAGADAEEEEKNEYGDPKRPNKEKYIATYTIKCQVSGWLYNFQVVGSNLRDMYDKELTDDTKWHDLYYAYCFDKEEKKAGVWNRLANDFENRYGWVSRYQRYTKDGTVTNTWDPKDTIIIAAHNSHRLNNPGVAPAGTQFAYSFQSMANLWNKDDWIEIRPTFKYVKDGTTYTLDPNSGTNMETSGTPESLHVYYDDYETGNEVKRLVEYGSSTDATNWHSVKLADEMFLGSYLKDDADRSARYPEPDYSGGDIRGFHDTQSGNQESLTNAFLNKVVDNVYTLKDIKLKSGLRIFSGDEDQLKTGLKQNHGATVPVTTQYQNSSGVQPLMDHAVQTWYGEYWLPSDLYITTKTRAELEDYANKHGGLQADDPVFMHDGLLIVHFDIIAHNSKDPDQDLRYSGGNGGSHGFKNEKAGDPGDPDDYYDVQVDDPPKTVEVQYGDVIMIDPDKKLEDAYKAAYWTIN